MPPDPEYSLALSRTEWFLIVLALQSPLTIYERDGFPNIAKKILVLLGDIKPESITLSQEQVEAMGRIITNGV